MGTAADASPVHAARPALSEELWVPVISKKLLIGRRELREDSVQV